MRLLTAWVCLLAAVALYAPLAAAAWSAHSMACCTGDQCPIAAHHHQKKQASPHSDMDCGHDMVEMTTCSMSCCQNSENPIVTAVAFVLPDTAVASAPIAFVNATSISQSTELLRRAEPLSPPPRFAVAL
jgi:hypothetical protein